MMLIQTVKLGIRGQVEVQRMTGEGSGTVETSGTEEGTSESGSGDLSSDSWSWRSRSSEENFSAQVKEEAKCVWAGLAYNPWLKVLLAGLM